MKGKRVVEINLWNSNNLLQEWLDKHSSNILKCDFDFDVLVPASNCLIDSISSTFGIAKENIAISAGISELINTIINAPLWNNIYFFNPEFGLYSKCISNSMYQSKVIMIDNDNVHDIHRLLENYHTEHNDLLCVSSPNWYTGEKMTVKEVKETLRSFHGVIVIDEAYVNYSDCPEALIEVAENTDRVILLRSFSKGWFMSGLRVGFMISKRYAAKFRNELIMPHSVSSPSLRLTNELLNDNFLMRCFATTRKDVVKTREYIKIELKDISYCKIYQSESNFITAILDARYEDKKMEVEKAFGAKIMNVNYSKNISIKYWISDMQNAIQFVETIRNLQIYG